MPYVGTAMAGSAIVGGLMAKSASKKAAESAAQQQRAAQYNIDLAVAELEKLGLPSIEAQKIVLEQPELVGLLTAETLGPSAMEGIRTDPGLESAQRAALTDLRSRSVTGLTSEDLASYDQLRSGLKSQQMSQEAGILQSLAERGASGSGQELAVRLNAGQQGNQNAFNQGNMIAAEAAKARREALSGYGNMAGQMRNQQFGEQSDVARARDLINQFNLTNRQGIAAKNLAARQALNENQVGLRNQQEIANKGLFQQNFSNELAKSQAIAGARAGQAQMNLQGAQQTLQAGQNKAQGIANMFGGISQGAAAYGTYSGQQDQLKDNAAERDLRRQELRSYKYDGMA